MQPHVEKWGIEMAGAANVPSGGGMKTFPIHTQHISEKFCP